MFLISRTFMVSINQNKIFVFATRKFIKHKCMITIELQFMNRQ